MDDGAPSLSIEEDEQYHPSVCSPRRPLHTARTSRSRGHDPHSDVARMLPSLEHRLVDFYQKYNPEKIPVDMDVLSHYTAREIMLSNHLKKKYPGSNGIAVRPVPGRNFSWHDVTLELEPGNDSLGLVVAHEAHRSGSGGLAQVDGVMHGTMAERCGVVRGDIIAAINNMYIAGPAFNAAVRQSAINTGERCLTVNEALTILTSKGHAITLCLLRQHALTSSSSSLVNHPLNSTCHEEDISSQCGSIRVYTLRCSKSPIPESSSLEAVSSMDAMQACTSHELYVLGKTKCKEVVAQIAQMLHVPASSFGLFDTFRKERWMVQLDDEEAVLPHVARWAPEDVETGRQLVFKRWVYDPESPVEQALWAATSITDPMLTLAYNDAVWHARQSLYALSLQQTSVLAALQVVADSNKETLVQAAQGFYPPLQPFVPLGLLQRHSTETVVQKIISSLQAILDGSHVACANEHTSGTHRWNNVSARLSYLSNLSMFPTYGCLFFPATEFGGRSLTGMKQEMMIAVGLNGLHAVSGPHLTNVETFPMCSIVHLMLAADSDVLVFEARNKVDKDAQEQAETARSPITTVELDRHTIASPSVQHIYDAVRRMQKYTKLKEADQEVIASAKEPDKAQQQDILSEQIARRRRLSALSHRRGSAISIASMSANTGDKACTVPVTATATHKQKAAQRRRSSLLAIARKRAQLQATSSKEDQPYVQHGMTAKELNVGVVGVEATPANIARPLQVDSKCEVSVTKTTSQPPQPPKSTMLSANLSEPSLATCSLQETQPHPQQSPKELIRKPKRGGKPKV